MASTLPKLKQKLIVMMIMLGVLFLLLGLRLTQVMIFQAEELQERAMGQWTSRSTLYAQRGRILDRAGLVLAQTGTSYRVLANPQWINEKERVRIAVELSDILELNYDYVLERVSNTNRKQVQLKRKVSAGTVAEIQALQFGSGISFTTDYKRYYPFGKLLAQLVGFSGVDGEGQTGLEAELNTYLAGENGLLIADIDRKGRPLKDGKEDRLPAKDGYDIELTVDSVTQTYLEKYLGECRDMNRAVTVSGIIMNPQTGEILAEGTWPSFDLNNPPRDDVLGLMSMSRSRIATDTYEAGTIFKVITLAAALDSGAVTMDSTFECNGSMTFRTDKLYCPNNKKHGRQTLIEAVQNDCNCAFMEMALRMGADTFMDYIYAFGFDTKTDCGIPSEDSGEVAHRKYLRDYELARLSCGNDITVTGVQLAMAISAAVNGGVVYQPHVVKRMLATDGTVVEERVPTELRRVIRSDTSEKVRTILQAVVEKGNGSNARMDGYTIGGKSGSVQKHDDFGRLSQTQLIASFVGFLPTNRPELLCLITVDEPQVPVLYGSLIAAPYVKKIFENLVQYNSMLPDTVTDMKEVPDVRGRTGDYAADILVSEGFTATMARSEEEASVVVQLPEPGTMAPRGSTVLLYTNMTTYNAEGYYADQSTVPDFIKRRRQDAYDAAVKNNLTINYDRSACIGVVVSQSIESGTKVDPGTEVYLVFEPTERQLEQMASWAEDASEGGTGDTETDPATPDPNAPEPTTNVPTAADPDYAGDNSDVENAPNLN